MTLVLSGLIDKQDNVEIIRDQIAGILVTEVANQQALAPTPADFKLNVFTERSNAWEQFLNENPDPSPIVNIWVDGTDYDKSKSNAVDRQMTEATYNIDCFGYGRAVDDPGGGHKPGDREANFEVQRCARLVRNILMAALNIKLQLTGLVWERWLQTETYFQPQLDSNTVQQIAGARLAFRVRFNEFSPEFDLETLEFVSVDVFRTEDGKIVLEADYPYPLP